MHVLLISLLSYSLVINGIGCVNFTYHDYDELTDLLKMWNRTKFDTKVRLKLYSIGKSVEERELWVMEVTAGMTNDPSLPNVKLIANMHGNEVVGRELLLHYIEFLFSSYSKDDEITWLLDNTRLHIMPSMNPDGFEAVKNPIGEMCSGQDGRGNARQIDLNRNFPDYYRGNPQPLQLETKALMRWMTEVPFILSADLHAGTVVANYPFNTRKTFKSYSKEPSLTSDNDVFEHLAITYANNHASMYKGLACKDSDTTFDGGITNGAVWYSFLGGMQDYNYFKHGCMELIMEISCCKYPNAEALPGLWAENKQAFVKYSLQANQGVTGIVLDKFTKRPVIAVLRIEGRDMEFHNDATGRFWRLLLPGSYKISVFAIGYHNEQIGFDIPQPKRFPKMVNIQILVLNSSISTTTTSTSTALSTGRNQDPPTEDASVNDANMIYENVVEPVVGKVTSSSTTMNILLFLYIVTICILLA